MTSGEVRSESGQKLLSWLRSGSSPDVGSDAPGFETEVSPGDWPALVESSGIGPLRLDKERSPTGEVQEAGEVPLSQLDRPGHRFLCSSGTKSLALRPSVGAKPAIRRFTADSPMFITPPHSIASLGKESQRPLNEPRNINQ